MKMRIFWQFAIYSLLLLKLLPELGCTFDGSGPKLIGLPLLDSTSVADRITKEDKLVVFNDRENLHVVHGYACGEKRLFGAVILDPWVELPFRSNFEAGVVIHNGWRLRYQREEAQAKGFGATILDTRVDGKKLRWRVTGIISDDDADQVIEFCHYYTAIAWTANLARYVINQEDFSFRSFLETRKLGDMASSDSHTSLHSISRYIHNNDFKDFDSVSILPQGFGFGWADNDEDYFLQAAYQLTPSERSVYGKLRHWTIPYEPPPNLPIPQGADPDISLDYMDKAYVSWESLSIFKNGDAPDAFIFGDLVVAVAGDHFGMVQPHYSIRPRKQSSVGVLESGPTTIRETVRVYDLPFQIAVPVLTGWNLFLYIDDEQIREFGIWIESFKWTRTGLNSGDLEYTLVYTYDDDEQSYPSGEYGVSFFGVTGLYSDF